MGPHADTSEADLPVEAMRRNGMHVGRLMSAVTIQQSIIACLASRRQPVYA